MDKHLFQISTDRSVTRNGTAAAWEIAPEPLVRDDPHSARTLLYTAHFTITIPELSRTIIALCNDQRLFPTAQVDGDRLRRSFRTKVDDETVGVHVTPMCLKENALTSLLRPRALHMMQGASILGRSRGDGERPPFKPASSPPRHQRREAAQQRFPFRQWQHHVRQRRVRSPHASQK